MTVLLRERGVDVTPYEYQPELAPGRHASDRFPSVQIDVGADPVRLPYEASAFDAVLSCGVLEHVRDPDASLQELRRVLRPGGTLYVYKLPNRYSYLEAVARRIGLYYHGKHPDDQVYTPSTARERVARHGYRVAEVRLANMLPLRHGGGRMSRLIWSANRLLTRVPALNRVATNVDVIATAP
jgi:SAM-dependent methyltransferase